MVIAPCRNRIAVSRSIEDEAERTRLGDLAGQIIAGENADPIEVEGMDGPAGWVIRTAAVGMQADELAADMASVAAQWDALIDQAEEAKPPSLLHEDLGRLNAPCATLCAAALKLFALKAKPRFAPRKPIAASIRPTLLTALKNPTMTNICSTGTILTNISKRPNPPAWNCLRAAG